MKKPILIISIVSALILIIGGFAIVNSSKNKDKSGSTTIQNVTTTNEAPLSGGVTRPNKYNPSEGGKYLVIKEWNVRFKLTSETKDAKVIYKNGKPFGLTTTAVEKIEGCKGAEIRSLRRAKLNEEIAYGLTVEKMLQDSPSSAVKIGEYYYAPFNPGWSCVQSGDSEDQKLAMNVSTALTNAFKTLESYENREEAGWQ